jgi:hypothetical protein
MTHDCAIQIDPRESCCSGVGLTFPAAQRRGHATEPRQYPPLQRGFPRKLSLEVQPTTSQISLIMQRYDPGSICK